MPTTPERRVPLRRIRAVTVAMTAAAGLLAAPTATPASASGTVVDLGRSLSGPQRTASGPERTLPPPPTTTLPPTPDALMPYEPQRICDWTARPGVLAFADLMATHYHRDYYGIGRVCLSDISEHYDGRALDWMLDINDPADKAIATAVTTWLTKTDNRGNLGARARRFGIMYIIWDHRIWGSYRAAEGWRPYTGSNPHTDHIHFSFSWDGACQRTSWWSKKPVLHPDERIGCTTTLVKVATEFTPFKATTLTLGATGDAVRVAQANLLGVTVDGDFGEQTLAAVRAFRKRWGLPVSGQVNRAVWNQMERLRYPLIKYRTTTVLRPGATGPAVNDVQRALGLPVTGTYDAATVSAVKAAQWLYRLDKTGVIDPLTWSMLDVELRLRGLRPMEGGD